ncbi:MAG TPA: hypothetical protein VFZ66_27155 [Herpetosiphonaceae bacterium]
MHEVSNRPTAAPSANAAGHAHPVSGVAQVGHFFRHFLEMCVTMCAGGILLNLLVLWTAAQIGYPHLRHQFPEVALLIVAFNYALPMVAWMRFRGMAWRPNLEMAGATFGAWVLLVGGAWLGMLPRSGLGDWWLHFCTLACPLMFVIMLFRLDLYTGRAGHHAHAA